MKRRYPYILILLYAMAAIAQTSRPARNPRDLQEFPLRIEKKVVAGQTPVGSAVAGKLEVPTLVLGEIIPANAEFTGSVEESDARSGGKPSRLKVHITSARWGEHTMAFDLYATNYYYPQYIEMPIYAERRRPRTQPLSTTKSPDRKSVV